MKIAFFSTQNYDRNFFEQANTEYNFEITYFKAALNQNTATMAQGYDAVCVFVNDKLDPTTLEILANNGIRFIALRCAGFNNVDLTAAKQLNLQIVRVPEYSPYAVAEHTIALLLALNRKIHKAYNRVREHNFKLDGLLGFDLHGKTAGIIGAGKIGQQVAKILHGIGCQVLVYDPKPGALDFAEYVSLEDLFTRSHVISLNCPLLPETQHLVNADTINQMKQGVLLINSGRGGLLDTKAVICGLKSAKIGGLGLDVYEQESSLFFQDHGMDIIQDEVFERLLTFPNVIITGHQGFFTKEALNSIANVTLENLSCLQQSKFCSNTIEMVSS